MTQYLYLIQCKDKYADGVYKIGVANDVESRLAQLQTGNPYELEIVDCFEFANSEIAERAIHQAYAKQRMRGEWFQLGHGAVEKFQNLCTMLGGIPYVPDQYETTAEAVEEAEEIQEAINHPNVWDYSEMFADGWQMETNGNGRDNGKKKYWGWRKRKDGQHGYIYGGAVSDLPYPIEEMRRIYRDGLEPIVERTTNHEG